MSVIWGLETSVLRDIAVILVVYGASSSSQRSWQARIDRVAVRRWLAPTFRHHPIVVWAAVLFLFLILLAWGPAAGSRQLLGVLLLAATTAIAIEALRRQTLREFPEDPHRQSGRPLERPSPASAGANVNPLLGE